MHYALLLSDHLKVIQDVKNKNANATTTRLLCFFFCVCVCACVRACVCVENRFRVETSSPTSRPWKRQKGKTAAYVFLFSRDTNLEWYMVHYITGWDRMQCSILTNRRHHNVNFNLWTILSFDRHSSQKTSPYWLSTQRMRLKYNYGHLLSASSLGDEPYALHSNDYKYSAILCFRADPLRSSRVWPNKCLPSTARVWISVQFHVAFLHSELRSCVKIEMAVLGSRLISLRFLWT